MEVVLAKRQDLSLTVFRHWKWTWQSMCGEGKHRANDMVNTEWTGEETGPGQGWQKSEQSARIFALRTTASEEEIALLLDHTSHEKTHSYRSLENPESHSSAWARGPGHLGPWNLTPLDRSNGETHLSRGTGVWPCHSTKRMFFL